MSILEVIKTGFSKAVEFKKYIFINYCVNFILAAILAAGLASVLEDSFGSSLAGNNMNSGYDDLWFRSFTPEAAGMAATFRPDVIGKGAVARSLDSFLTGEMHTGYTAIAGVGLVYLLFSVFFGGGYISSYSNNTVESFFGAASENFLRLLGLAAIAAFIYHFMFMYLFGWMTDIVNSLTRESVDERVHFALVSLKYFIFWAGIWKINILFDYSKIAAVSADISNPFGAILFAVKKILKNWTNVFGIYFAIGIAWSALTYVYWLIAPGSVSGAAFYVIYAFFIGQIYILARIFIRCLFLSSQTVYSESVVDDFGDID